MAGDRLITARIMARNAEAEDIVSLLLAPLPGEAFPPFEAGAHVELHVADGIVRPYSLANDPAERDRYLLGILRESNSRGGSSLVHDTLTEGMEVAIGAPRNLFPLVAHAGHSILLAGGIGVTPLLAMAHRLHSALGSFELHVCCRRQNRVPFDRVLRAGPFASSVQVHLDEGPVEQRLDLRRVLAERRPDSHIYVCGPSGFIDHVTATAAELGWPAHAVHLERFDAEPELSGGAFRVVLSRSGTELLVPADRTLAEVLIEHGVPLSISCERGICGTCLTPVRDGQPDHRDLYQTDEQKAENTHMTPCCSRSLSPRLVLDL
jgi:vanillate O-demethylase ferredoxin subunit